MTEGALHEPVDGPIVDDAERTPQADEGLALGGIGFLPLLRADARELLACAGRSGTANEDFTGEVDGRQCSIPLSGASRLDSLMNTALHARRWGRLDPGRWDGRHGAYRDDEGDTARMIPGNGPGGANRSAVRSGAMRLRSTSTTFPPRVLPVNPANYVLTVGDLSQSPMARDRIAPPSVDMGMDDAHA